jgi:membrane protein implicated in regulation of membrane protease activity
MTVGGSLFLIAVGAILYFAVTAELAGIDIQVVGLILMVVGVVGLALGLLFLRRRPGPGPGAPPPGAPGERL